MSEFYEHFPRMLGREDLLIAWVEAGFNLGDAVYVDSIMQAPGSIILLVSRGKTGFQFTIAEKAVRFTYQAGMPYALLTPAKGESYVCSIYCTKEMATSR